MAFPGGAAASAFFTRAGRDVGRIRIVDGSGLSRMNLVCARDMVAAVRMTLADDASFADMLPLAGRTGTLRERFLGTALEANLRAKTGALTGHRNLLGVATLASGRRIIVAVMVQATPRPRTEVDPKVDAFLVEWVGARP